MMLVELFFSGLKNGNGNGSHGYCVVRLGRDLAILVTQSWRTEINRATPRTGRQTQPLERSSIPQ